MDKLESNEEDFFFRGNYTRTNSINTYIEQKCLNIYIYIYMFYHKIQWTFYMK